MSLTPPGDLYVGLNDSMFGKALSAIKTQRPSLLNYATDYFAKHPENWCVPISPPSNGAPLITVMKSLQVAEKPVPPVEFLLQITNILVGFGVDNVGLPASMKPLPAQRIAVKVSFSSRFSIPKLDPATIGCPDSGQQFDNSNFPLHLCPCFSGDLFLTATGAIKPCGQDSWITFALDRFESTNVTPASLRETADYFLVLLVDTTVLPKMWVKLKPFVIDLSKTLPPSANIKTITITPGTPTAPPNPNIAADLLEARFTVAVTTP
jgi:hypothetical protein